MALRLAAAPLQMAGMVGLGVTIPFAAVGMCILLPDEISAELTRMR